METGECPSEATTDNRVGSSDATIVPRHLTEKVDYEMAIDLSRVELLSELF
jgi:hypothetical protein